MWALHLSTEVDGRKDARDFAAASCADLAATAGVVLAVAIDPTRAAPPPVDATAPPSAPDPPREDPPPPPALAREPADVVTPLPSRSMRQFVVAAGGAGSVGVLASPAFGVELGAAWVPHGFRVEVDGLWFPATEITGSAAGTGGSFSLLGAAAKGCWIPLDRRIRLGGCVGAQGGGLEAQANGLTVTTSMARTSTWVAATAGGLLVGRVFPHIGLRASLDLVVPFERDQFYVGGVETVHTPSPVAAQSSIGVEVQIP